MALTPVAVSHSRLHARRVTRWGYRGPAVTVLPGLYAPRGDPPEPVLELATPPQVLFVGRHIAEKRVPLVVAGYLEARRVIPDLRLLILGDGPDRVHVRSLVQAAGLDPEEVVPGFVPAARLEAALRSSACLVLPSEREGHGMVVVEAAAHGTPSVVVAGPDNAAVELVQPGRNGAVAALPTPHDVGAALVEVVRAGPGLRSSTAHWFREQASTGTVARSAQTIQHVYQEAHPW